MKKILILLSVMVLTLAVVSPAMASWVVPEVPERPKQTPVQTRQGYQSASFLMTGKIAEIGADYVVINVIRGNKLVKPFVGTLATVLVTPTTRYRYTDGVTTVKITFADLQVDQKVSVYGTFTDNVWTATRITVGAKLSCLP